MTEDQVKEMAAELRPKAPPPPLFRKLPTPRNDSSGSATEPAPSLFAQAPATTAVTALSPPAPASPVRAAANSRGRLEPIAADRHVLRVTVDGAFVADLQVVRQALSHKMPGAALEAVLHECIRTTLRQIEKRRQGAGRKKTAETPPPGSTFVPAPVRKEVCERDEGQCTFVSEGGRRCSSRHQLEFHHLLAVALGGLSTTDNVCLRCRAHNRYAAEQDFGQEHVAGKIASRREQRREGSAALDAERARRSNLPHRARDGNDGGTSHGDGRRVPAESATASAGQKVPTPRNDSSGSGPEQPSLLW
jgi:5-methylcytosine-specific restriction endonuclease McrA